MNAADAATTCPRSIPDQAIEGNPLISGILGKRPKCGELIAFKAATAALHWALASETQTTPEPKWFQVVSIVVQGGVVTS